MNLDIATLLTPEIKEAIRIFALFVSLFHLLVGLILFRNIITASNLVSSPRSVIMKLISLVHILLLTAILLLVIFYNQLPG